jgi:hypothetical protein
MYKPGINSTVNEHFVMYDVTFVLKNASSTYKATCSMLQKITLNMSVFVSHVQHASENNTKYMSIFVIICFEYGR